MRDGEHRVAILLRPDGQYPRIRGLAGGLEVISGDLARQEALAEPLLRFRPDVVVHAAWAQPTAKNRNEVEHADHAGYTVRLARLAHAVGAAHFIGIGSQAEYGAAADRNSTKEPPAPITLYGTAKLCAGLLSEKVCAALGMRFAWLRLFSAYGPGEDPTWLIPSMCTRLLARKVPATTAGEQLYDYLFIDDVADAIFEATARPQAAGFFDLGSGHGHTVREVIERVRDLIDPSLPIGFGEVAYAPDQVMRMEADVKRLREVTGWQPTTDLDTGLRRVVDWFRQNGSAETVP